MSLSPAFLRKAAYARDDLLSDQVVSAIETDGRVVSGWHMRSAPAELAKEGTARGNWPGPA